MSEKQGTRGHTAVMAQKRAKLKEPKPWQRLEFFPTPPWATRALFAHAVFFSVRHDSVWEPCAGLGHMATALAEVFAEVRASDVYNYPTDDGRDGELFGVGRFDFLDAEAVSHEPMSDWVVTNPPFGQAAKMLENALAKARVGVAFLLRMQWLEGGERYETIYADCAPTFIAPFVERVPMCEGGWDPAGSTATMYAWFVWLRGDDGWVFSPPDRIEVRLIPPGCADRLTRPSDVMLGLRCVPGWIAPSILKKSSREQTRMEFGA
ncbi:MAG: SAM-dependent DNA methyltransferase [Roseiarcus sp.]